MAFISGCVKTETVIVEKKVAAIPPTYLWDSEPLPEIPAGLEPDERTGYLVEGYASRGDVIRRDKEQEALMRKWEAQIKKLYPETLVHPLDEVEPESDAPQQTGK